MSQNPVAPTAIRWRILALLVFASFISYVLRYNVSTAGPAMMLDLNLTEIQFGYVLAAFTVGYTVFQFPGGMFAVALGPRRALTIVMLLWALFTVLTSLTPGTAVGGTTFTLITLIVVRFLVGAVHAPIYPLTAGVVGRWFPAGSWALPNGLSSTGLTLGTAATAPILAWALSAYGWRLSFVMLAPLGLVGAALWWWYARDNAAGHPSVNASEVRLIHAGKSEVEALDHVRLPWLQILKNRNVLLLTISYFGMNYIFYLMFNWVFYYLVEIRGFETQQAGFLTSAQWIAAAVGATVGGWLCDKLCRRIGMQHGCSWLAMFGVSLSGLLLLVASLSNNAAITVACLAASFLFNQLTEGAFWAAGIAIGGRHAAEACGVMNTGGNAVGFVNALLIPVTAARFGWTAAMMTGVAFAFLSAILWLFIRIDEPIPD